MSTATTVDFGISRVTAADLRRVFDGTPGLAAVWIYGSRARGTARTASDIDLAIDAPTLSPAGFAALHNRLLALPTLYGIDAVHWQTLDDALLRAEIERDRQTFWTPPA